MNMRNIFRPALLCALAMLAAGCRHKPLYVAPEGGDSMEILFDWRYAPEANPASMAAYMFPTDGNPQAQGGLRYVFTGRDGGSVRIPYGSYIAVGMNSDINDWSVLTDSDDPDLILISTPDADVLDGRNIPARMVPRHEAAAQQRIAKSPGMLWTDHVEGVTLKPSPLRQTVTLYPEERICRYYVDVLDVENIANLSGGPVDATLSGIAEGVLAGRDAASDNPVTMPLVLTPDTGADELHGMFYTFGDTPASKNAHILTLYLILESGEKWACSFNVTDQVDNAPDPKNVHIVVRGLELPDPQQSGPGLVPDVNDWEAVYIDLPM